MTIHRALWALGLAASLTGAESWRRVSGIDTTRGVYSTVLHGGVFYAATDSLVYRSADGLSWLRAATQPATGRPYYVLHANDSGVYAGTDHQGVHRTRDGGQTWAPVGSGLPNEDVLGLATLGDSLYAGLGFSGVYVLDLKNPSTWSACNTGLTQFGSNWIGAVDGRLFAGLGYSLFTRARGASQWSEATIGTGQQRQFYGVIASGAHFFGASSNGVYRADASNPTAWQLFDIAGLNGRYVSAVVARGSRVFANVNYQGHSWIWSTDNAGVSWDVRAHEFAPAYQMFFVGDRMWVARGDGLWYYDFEPVALRPGPRPASKARSVGDRLPVRRLDGRRVRSAENGPGEITLPRSP